MDIDIDIEVWITGGAFIVSILSLALSVYSFRWSKKSFKIQHNNSEYMKKIEMYKKLQDFFESEKNYNKSDVKIFGGSFKEKDFTESKELFIKEIKDVFGNKIEKRSKILWIYAQKHEMWIMKL